MEIRVPEPNKKPGVHYAVTGEGVELPVVDVTHSAFALAPSEADLARLTDESLRSARSWRKMPGVAQWLASRLILGQGALTRGIASARGTYLSGMSTYLLKLGPENLGAAWAKPMDRTVAGTLPSVSARLRLQDMARLIAEGASPALYDRPTRPFLLLNVGGGPATDSLNALLLLRRDRPGLLTDRRIAIWILDCDAEGPGFGARALEALSAGGAPLHGLAIALEHVPYDWADPGALRNQLERRPDGAFVACSSEGGLFEYASDDEILHNLEVLRDCGPMDAIVVGSVTRTDEQIRVLHEMGGTALRMRPLQELEPLARQAGWAMAATAAGPLSHQVRLVRAA